MQILKCKKQWNKNNDRENIFTKKLFKARTVDIIGQNRNEDNKRNNETIHF